MRRAAAILLQAAWYALLPPLGADRPDPTAPLGRWEQLRAFDSAEACERMTIAYARQIAAQTDNTARARATQVPYVRCVHAADPRLRDMHR